MRIVFSGAEVGSNRTLLEGQKVESMGLNFWGLRKRGLPKNKLWLISEHFDTDTQVYIESGAAQADKAGLSKEELTSLAVEYQEFLVNNAERATAFMEFDSLVLGEEWVKAQRPFYEYDPKFWVVWHEEYGLPALKHLSENHKNVVIPSSEIESVTSLSAVTRGYQRQLGTQYHALACAKPDNLRQIPFTSASTLSWISPMRRGETIVWDGTKLNRYPKRMKNQARPRYKSVVEKAGLDYLEFSKDSTLEATRVAVWSYLQLEKSMDKKTPDLHIIEGGKEFVQKKVVSDNSNFNENDFFGLGVSPSDNKVVEERKVSATELVQRAPEELTNLPVFGYEMKDIVDSDGSGKDVIRSVPVVSNLITSVRQCDTCFVASNCPAFKPSNTCAFNLPIEVKTKEQLKGLLTAIIEMQGTRVAFMRYAEQLNGDYADPNLSQEIDRLIKLVKEVDEMGTSKETLQITASRHASSGVLSAIFGDKVQAMREYPQAIPEEQVTRIIQQKIEE